MEYEYLKHMTEMDATTLQSIMEQYGGHVWNYAYFLTKDRQLADDITQDVYIKAYYRIETYHGNASFKTWLLTIARNTAFRYKRHAFLKKVTLVDAINYRQEGQSAENEYIEASYTDDIWRIIMALPDKYREVLVLDMYHELTNEEASKLLNVSTGTVKSRLHRARKKVQHKIKEEML